jgi:hypothetical protein
MKVPIYLLWYIFLCKLLTDFQVDADCFFQYGTDRDYYSGHCLCGPENQTVSFQENNYCCVHNQKTCKVNESTKLCPNATVLYNYQPCHGTCMLDKIQCPSNPNYCMGKSPWDYVPACDGQQRCEEFCSGSIEQFPYYNNITKLTCNCGGLCSYCGKRDGAKYHNFQCSVPDTIIDYEVFKLSEEKLSYSCLNRVDIAEERIRESVIYDSKISNRKNLFEIFKANNTMNSVNQTHIVCGDKTLNLKSVFSSIHCKKEKDHNKEIPVTALDVISAFDFLHDRGLQVDHKNSETNYVMYPLGMYVFTFNYLTIEYIDQNRKY